MTGALRDAKYWIEDAEYRVRVYFDADGAIIGIYDALGPDKAYTRPVLVDKLKRRYEGVVHNGRWVGVK